MAAADADAAARSLGAARRVLAVTFARAGASAGASAAAAAAATAATTTTTTTTATTTTTTATRGWQERWEAAQRAAFSTKWVWSLAPRKAWKRYLDGLLGPTSVPSPWRCRDEEERKREAEKFRDQFPVQTSLGQLELAFRAAVEAGEFTVVTTTMEGAHQEAGSSQVIELHGSIRRFRCIANGHHMSLAKINPEDRSKPADPPQCDKCQSLARPDCVLVGETVSQEDLARAQLAAAHLCATDVCLVVGDPEMAYPAAFIPELAASRGATVIVIAQDGAGVVRAAREARARKRAVSNNSDDPAFAAIGDDPSADADAVLHLQGDPARLLADVVAQVKFSRTGGDVGAARERSLEQIT